VPQPVDQSYIQNQPVGSTKTMMYLTVQRLMYIVPFCETGTLGSYTAKRFLFQIIHILKFWEISLKFVSQTAKKHSQTNLFMHSAKN